MKFEIEIFCEKKIIIHLHFASLCTGARAQKIEKVISKGSLRFGTDDMVRPNYSVLVIGDSVRPNLGSVENIEIRFGRTEWFGRTSR